MKRGLSFLLAIIVVFCTLSSITATVYADYDANLIAHQKIDYMLHNYVDPNFHLIDYGLTESEKAELLPVVEEVIVDCNTEYEKILAVTKLVAENIYYDYGYVYGGKGTFIEPYEIWTNKRTVCHGYATLMKSFLNLINIPCMYVLGDAHAYNIAFDSENDRWIYLDATWSSGNVYGDGKFYSGSYDEDYFDMPLEALLSHHEIYHLSIVVDEVIYELITPQSADAWSNLDEWYIEVYDVTEDFDVGTVDIVDSFDEFPVTSIYYAAFSDCTGLDSVTIPDSVTSIDTNAFYNCTSLTTITIPDSVTSIGYRAFENCTRLASITIPDSVTYIGGWAFHDCTSLTSITIPDSVTSIGNATFYGCDSLISITIPDSVISIDEYAFLSCSNLSNVFYVGSQDNWENISIKEYNYALTNAKIHYNSTTHTSSDWIVDKEPTCATAGSKHQECTVCKEVLQTQTIPKTTHKPSDWKVTKSATCLAEGIKQKECTICKVVLETQKIAKTGHTSSDWVTDKKATTSVAGSKHKECTTCKAVLETAEIPQLKCSKPKLKTIANTADGVKITWGKVSGADSYAVYRKTGSKGKYNKLTTTTKTGYTDKSAKSGKKYYYIVKAVNEAGSSSASSSKSIYYLADTTLKTPKSTKSGVTLNWTQIAGADGYMVYRKTGSGDYKKIATVKGVKKVKYTDKSAKKGKTYTYKIKAYKSKTYSAYSNAKKIKDKY